MRRIQWSMRLGERGAGNDDCNDGWRRPKFEQQRCGRCGAREDPWMVVFDLRECGECSGELERELAWPWPRW